MGLNRIGQFAQSVRDVLQPSGVVHSQNPYDCNRCTSSLRFPALPTFDFDGQLWRKVAGSRSAQSGQPAYQTASSKPDFEICNFARLQGVMFPCVPVVKERLLGSKRLRAIGSTSTYPSLPIKCAARALNSAQAATKYGAHLKVCISFELSPVSRVAQG